MSAEPPKPLDPEATPDASSRIVIDPTTRPSVAPQRAKSRSWSSLLRESWQRTPTEPPPELSPDAPTDPKPR